MLVLSRKKGESIVIGGNIEVVVLDTEGDTVKIGIQAPKQVDIYRKEVYLSIQLSNREAAQTDINLQHLSDLFKKNDEIR